MRLCDSRAHRWLIASLFLVLTSFVDPTSSDAVFTEVGSAMGVAYNGQGRSICWGDYDGDGWLDIYVGNVAENNILYRNRLGEGGQPFADMTAAMGVDNEALITWGVLWGDVDNDGDLDLYVANDFDGPNRLYRNDGAAFTECQDAMAIGGAVNNMGTAWSDFDRDGDLDNYVSILGQNLLYRSDDSAFVNIAQLTGTANTAVGFSVAWADYDNDGDPDFFCANKGSCFQNCDKQLLGTSEMYRNDGSVFTIVTGALNAALSDDAVGAAWGDYDNDGDLDLFVARDGVDHLFRNDGATFTDVAPGFGMDDPGNNKGGIWGDYDLDGDLDLFVTADGPSKLYRNDGASFAEVGAAEGVRDAGNTGSGTGAGWADYDNDGDVDLYVARRGGINRLFRNDVSNGNRWLIVQTNGLTSNRDGVGTRVQVVANGVSMLQEVSEGDGFFSMGSPQLEFGVGTATTVSLVQAVWPTGIVQTLTNRPTNAVIVLDEPTPAVKFTDVAASLGVANVSEARGVTWGDYDNDGDLDLFVANNGADLLYKNNGGTFTNVAGTLGIADAGSSSKSAVWLDYNNDGHLDLFVSNLLGSPNRLWKNLGSGSGFQDVATTVGIAPGSSNNWGAAWADFDRDGDLDLYQARKNQANLLYRNDGTTFVDVAASKGVNVNRFSKTAVWADYDEDGWPDLYVVTDSADVLYRNPGGGGAFTNVTAAAQINDTGDGRGASWGDMDNDGDLDLYVANDGPGHFYQNTGAGTFTSAEITWRLGHCGNDYSPVWVDFDGDRDLDLTLTSAGGTSRLLEKAGSFYRDVSVLQGVGHYGHTQGAAWADYDTDGDLDMYAASSWTANRLYQRTTAINSNWLRVRLIGSPSNRAAIGAIVRVTTGSVTQTRLVDGGSGWLSQGALWPHFFLGSATSIDQISVTWPSGTVDLVSNVAPVNRTLVLTEGVSPTVVIGDGARPGRFALVGHAPDPFLASTTIRFDVAREAHVSLVVYDAAGRRIRSLLDGLVPEGRREALWDGRDDAGRNVASGIYFYRFDAGGANETRRMHRVR